MRIVEYGGLPVKRQKKIGPNEIKITFYDNNPPIVVTGAQWEKYSRNRYYDDPCVKRSEVVHRHSLVGTR